MNPHPHAGALAQPAPAAATPSALPRTAPDDPALDAIYRRIAWRLMPILLLAQVLAYLDRVNIGTAKLQMAADLSLSATAYGLGAGIFFVGYFFFEVPSNLLLHRLGARAWIARIMVSWGLLSAAMGWVQSTTVFYVLRFLLGVAEAGFFPGIVLYLTYWFPAHRRGRMTTLFMSATAVAGIVGGPLSGWILAAFDGQLGHAGWRWMFVLEGLPSALVGVLVFFLLPSRPREVRWLNADALAHLEADLAQAAPAQAPLHRASDILNGTVLLFALIYFLLLAGLYGVSFWLPSVIRAAGIASTVTVGWLSAVPYAVAMVAMNVVARQADRRRNWGTLVGTCALVAGAGFCVSAFTVNQLAPAMAALTVASAGILSALPLFWNLPTARLDGVAAAAGIGFINAIGNLSGFVSPFAIGWLTDLTHTATAGVGLLGACAMLAGVLTLAYGRRSRPC
ncbi:MFS transporter [Ralstonia sp.]|uniref:MFS transporter n=1 Tax=Ralstonia sp. TaxID=54061 RepID=UPI0031DFA8F9